MNRDGNEHLRTEAVKRYIIVDPSEKRDLHDLIEVASDVCGTPMALVTLIDESTQYYKVKKGLEGNSTAREEAFCRYTISQPDVFIVEDAHLDTRFSSNPSVTGIPFIRFYAGVPLVTGNGFAIGSLCVIDSKPQTLDAVQISCLETLGRLVMHRMELSQSMRAMPGELSEDALV